MGVQIADRRPPRNQINTGMADKEKEATDWFIGKARSAAGYRKNIVKNDERGRDGAVIGKMYFFIYDPKHKDTLPMYDRFPLVFPIIKISSPAPGVPAAITTPSQAAEARIW